MLRSKDSNLSLQDDDFREEFESDSSRRICLKRKVADLKIAQISHVSNLSGP